MKKSSLFQLLTALAFIALLGTSWAQEAPDQKADGSDANADPTSEVRFPDQWGPTQSEPLSDEDTSIVERLERARALVMRRLTQMSETQYPSLPTPPSMRPRLGGSQVRPCLAQTGGTLGEPCAQARAISRMPACVRPEDCQAYHSMRQLVGEPEIRKVPAESEVPPWRPELASAPLPDSPKKE